MAKSDAVSDNASFLFNWFVASGTQEGSSNPNGESACAGYSEETDRSDKGLWRLPTALEGSVICHLIPNLSSVSLTPGFSYWVATRRTSNTGWRFTTSTLSIGYNETTTSLRVRCVRDPLIVSADYPKVMADNVIVLFDSPKVADPSLYPLHPRWFVTPVGLEGYWSNNDSGLNSYSAEFRVARYNAKNASGGDDHDTYSARGVKNSSKNPTGFSACASYSEQGAADGWRLPTAVELKMIWDCRKQLELEQSFLEGTLHYMTATDVECGMCLDDRGLMSMCWDPQRGYDGYYQERGDSNLRVLCVKDL